MAATTTTAVRGRSARRAGTGSLARFAARAAVVAGIAVAVASQTGQASADDCSSTDAPCTQMTPVEQLGQALGVQTQAVTDVLRIDQAPVEEIDRATPQYSVPPGVGRSVTAMPVTSSTTGDELAAAPISFTAEQRSVPADTATIRVPDTASTRVPAAATAQRPVDGPAALPEASPVDEVPQGYTLAAMNLLIPTSTRTSASLAEQVDRLGQHLDSVVADISLLPIDSGLVTDLARSVMQPVTGTVDTVTHTLVQARATLEPGLDKVTVPVAEDIEGTVAPLLPGPSPVEGGGSLATWTSVANSAPVFGAAATPMVTAVEGPRGGFSAATTRAQDLRPQTSPSILTAPQQNAAEDDAAYAAVPVPAHHASAGANGGIAGPALSGGFDHGQVLLAALRLPGNSDLASLADQLWRLPGSLTSDPGHSPD